MKGWASTVALVFIVGMGVGIGQPAFAEDRRQAMALYDQGVALYDHGDFLGAAKHFEGAFSAAANPTFLYNIAQCYRMHSTTVMDVRERVGFLERAISTYERYFQEYKRIKGKRPPHEQEVMGYLDEELIAVANLKKKLEEGAAAAAVKPIPPSPSAPVVAQPATAGVPPQALAASQTDISTSPATSSPFHKSQPVYKKWWLWTLVSVVVAGAATGLVLGLVPNDAARPSSQGANNYGTLTTAK